MPFPLVLAWLGYEAGQWQLDELAEERAAGEGMVERFVSLAGINEPRMLSWAEERALREDLRQSVDLVWSRPGRTVYRYPVGGDEWGGFYGSTSKMSVREWEHQYLQDPVIIPDHPDPGFGGVCPRREGSAMCPICELCLDHCKCRRAAR